MKIMLKKVPLVLGILLFVIFLYLMAIHQGFELGYKVGEKTFLGWTVIHGTAYEGLSISYGMLMLFSFFFIVGQKVANHYLAGFIGITSLLLTAIPFYRVYAQKSINFADDEIFSELTKQIIPLDLFCFLTILGLLIYQVMYLSKHMFPRKHII